MEKVFWKGQGQWNFTLKGKQQPGRKRVRVAELWYGVRELGAPWKDQGGAEPQGEAGGRQRVWGLELWYGVRELGVPWKDQGGSRTSRVSRG